MCLQRLITTYCNSVGQKEERERGEEAIQVLRYDEERRRNQPNEEKGDNGNKRSEEEVKQCIFCTPKKRRQHTGACALRWDFFFFLLFHPLSFSFSYKILQSGMRENNNSVSFTTGYVNTFQNQLLLKPSNKYKRKKKTFFPIPQGPGTSQRLSLHKHAQCFRTPLTGGNKRCGVVEISQPSTGEKKRSLKERHLLQHAFMRGFAC